MVAALLFLVALRRSSIGPQFPGSVREAPRSFVFGGKIIPGMRIGPRRVLLRPTKARYPGRYYQITRERKDSVDEKWEQVWEALLRYRDIHGNLLIPHSFVIPEDNPEWPSNLAGLKLGQKIRNMRSVGTHIKSRPERIEMLNEIGFVWDDNEFRWRQTLRALQKYKSIHGALNIPTDFIVPAEDPWDPICWGVSLGERVHNIRAHNLHIRSNPARRKILDDIGFVWENDDYKFKLTLEALEIYKKLTGHVSVEQKFIVPHNDTNWPDYLWGLRLGDQTRAVRTMGRWIKGNIQRQRQLQDIGLKPSDLDLRYERVLECLVKFKDLYGHTRVPAKFVVPPEAPWDPPHWNISLGERVRVLRRKKPQLPPTLVQKLDTLGFSWKPKEENFESFVHMLSIYKDRHVSSESTESREGDGFSVPRVYVVYTYIYIYI
ncbi:hypothetical protein AAMO2058_001535300 [Amorphochlora amoebiformis]